ncbi:unnamed protein product [Clonostachys solani]|uniref:Uncharacterized protein n=1 Tax=Clonostachys solani TaxID=160281 RepID=A0A9N9ZKE8_9HYPO|nr:unnamed protein product [Clonostachys solani]
MGDSIFPKCLNSVVGKDRLHLAERTLIQFWKGVGATAFAWGLVFGKLPNSDPDDPPIKLVIHNDLDH